ncbi:MAG: hypothetical protein OEN50_12120 [Deltaproteobacteria bacterium]|nr:hypothetical protein [Deltaproteobacteria bacterium]
MAKKIFCVIKLVFALTFLAGVLARASGDEFYSGKTILFIVGNPPGGGFDTYTRAVARYISRHILGNPTPIVQNMVAGAGVTAANYIYSGAKPDGLTMGVWNSALVLRQALGDRSIKFKADKFGWIGAPSKGFPACAIMGFTGLRTLEDVLTSKKPIKMGGVRPGITPTDLPKVLNLTLGTKFDVISGFESVTRIRIAMQMREVGGVCYGWESMRTTARSMLDASGDGKLIPFITHGDSQDPEVKDLPRLNEVIKGKENLAILNAWLRQFDFFRPFTLPPGAPKERLDVVRKAFEATLQDPEFLAEAKRSKLVIDHVSGEEIENFVDQILAISPNTKAKLQFLVSEKEK